MSDIFKFADELGPVKIIHVHEPSISLNAVLVIDNVAMGPSIGGVRMAPDVSTEECFRLARSMTFKNSAAGLPHGGGKVVIYGDPKMPKKEKATLIRALACALRTEEDYIFAPDMGTDEECMAWIRDEIGRVVALPRELGGIPLDVIGATGWGLLNAAQVALDHRGMSLKGATIAVQGFGAVGRNASRFLTDREAVLVGVSDSRGAVHNPDGLEVAKLIALKDEGRSVIDYPGGKVISPEELVALKCDIWIPAARPDVINEGNVASMKAKIIIEGANIPLTLGAEKHLFDKGVLCVPDFIANAGGVICAAMEYNGTCEKTAMEMIQEKILYNTHMVLKEAASRKVLPREAAIDLARERVKKAMSYRRWSSFSSSPGYV